MKFGRNMRNGLLKCLYKLENPCKSLLEGLS